jgi:O-antigen ligase
VRLEKPFLSVFFFVLATVPLLFGARHPLIHGLYSGLLLLAGGGFLLSNAEWKPGRLYAFPRLAPVLLLLFIFLTAIALPSFLLGLLSPVRAEYLSNAIRITGLRDAVTSLSYYAPASMFYAVYGTALLLFFYAARALLGSEEMLRKALWVITLVGLFEAVYGLLQATNPGMGVLWLELSPELSGGYARGTIIYRNQYASFLNLCWPLALALGISLYKPDLERLDQSHRRSNDLSPAANVARLFQKAAIPLWSAGLMILAVVFSQSRGGILVMLLTATLFIYLLSVPRRFKVLFAGSLLLFICFYGGIIGFEQVIERFTFFYESSLARFGVWNNSLAMLWDHFLTGIGMGGYEFLSPVYLKDIPAGIWYDRAHNEYVELAIELGIPMMLLFLAWVGRGMNGFGLALLRTKRGRRSLSRMRLHDIVAIGAFCGITGLLLHAWVDFVWRLPATVIYAVILLAILGGRESFSSSSSSSSLSSFSSTASD